MHPSINILRSYEELEDDGFEEKVQWAAQETSGLWGGFLQLMKWWIPWIWPSHWRSDPTSSFAKRQKRPSSILGVGVLWNMILITEPVPQHNRNMIFYTMCVCVWRSCRWCGHTTKLCKCSYSSQNHWGSGKSPYCRASRLAIWTIGPPWPNEAHRLNRHAISNFHHESLAFYKDGNWRYFTLLIGAPSHEFITGPPCNT